ncbi:transporter substrate-binding domain-containing protein [Caballeronia sp. SEWSISQ10-4 2]|uniref:substrate-binding periplasmic protein n=1 Tax=Caballeronia sp. SEWSISQ10-4 2 TaxID=2937438 RepID=UPI002655B822|nr:transporter substrate-binding domain-containing protein [Caballeronia sp. SEWSISQ10-4 2]MDN7182561.1 transporter substrate-binding domain-containing protein [Caballeronia sp. SEWSISQ10-4 2]
MASDGVGAGTVGLRYWLRTRNRTAVFLLVLACISAMLSRFVTLEKPFAAASLRGRLIVAVPPRPAPVLTVGHVDRTLRSPDPFSAALAADLGRRLGLPVDLLLSEPDAAAAAVATGKADAAIDGLPFQPGSTLSFSPASYASGRGQALVLRRGNVHDWAALRGGSICTPIGNAYGPHAARLHSARLITYGRPLDALLAFQAGECTALVDDELVIKSLLKLADWSYYSVLPGNIAPTPSFIATPGGDAASMRFVDTTIRDWRQSRWLTTARESVAKQLAFDMFVAENDLYCH